MVVVYDNGHGSRVFANIWPMFGGMCVHTSTGTIYTFKAGGPDQRLWLYSESRRSEDGFEWNGGQWTAIAERAGGIIRVLSKGKHLGQIEGGEYIIDAYTYMLLRDDVLERCELGATPPNPFRVW